MLAQTKETKVILLGPQNTDVKLFILVLMGFLLSLLSVNRKHVVQLNLSWTLREVSL